MTTREQLIQDRNAADRTKATAERARQTPTFAAFSRNGAVELVVRNPTPELRDIVKGLGYTLTVDIANRYAIVVSTPAEMDSARNPLRSLFTTKGEWVGIL